MLPGAQQQVVLGQGHAYGQRIAVQLAEHLEQLVFEPGMQHRIGRREHPLRTDRSGCRAKEGQQFGRSSALILMGVSCGEAIGMPTGAGLWDRLIRSGFILAPHR
jgi:hypothetical protein